MKSRLLLFRWRFAGAVVLAVLSFLVLASLVPAANNPILPVAMFGYALAFLGYVLLRRWRKRAASPWRFIGWGVWSGCVLALVAIPLFSQQGVRARIEKAERDLRLLSRGVEQYRAHTGRVPPKLDDLTRTATNASGVRGGPFVESLPYPAGCFSGYVYETRPDGTYSLSVVGQGLTLRVASGGTIVRDAAPASAEYCPGGRAP